MSASLVGSEMCIRDRPLCGRGGGGVPAPGGPGGGPPLPPGGAPAPLSLCLLYTSDAADDM
eukprot:15339345-Alexandrium_andersonii.AAC.1